MAIVLFIDDDPATLFMLSKAIGLYHHVPLVAHDLASALQQVETVRPDIIFVDLNLGRETGLSVLRLLRDQMQQLAQTPTIVMSASPKKQMVDYLPANEVQHIMEKPIHLSDLLEAIHEYTN